MCLKFKVKQFSTIFFLRWLPVYVDKEQRIGVMSIGFLLGNQDDAVVWRGPKKNGSFIYVVDILLSM